MTVKEFNLDWNPNPHHFTAKELQRLHEGLPPWESVSFGCGGLLLIYLFGVAKALQAAKLDKGVRYYGCSAGALAAVSIVVGAEMDEAMQYCKEKFLPIAYKRVDGLFMLSENLTECVKATVLPHIPSEGIPDNTLNIATTKLPTFEGEIISKFDSTDDLMLSLLASSAAFPFGSLVNKQGQWYIDGGWTSFQPVEDEKTVTISALYFSDCDIKPSRYVPLWWSFIPTRSNHTVDWLYSLGFEDGLAYITKRGIHINEEVVNQYRPKKVGHPYDRKRRVSIHRLLGYQWSNLSNYYLTSILIDSILMLILVLVIKPFLLSLIYIELAIRMIVLVICSLTFSLRILWQPYDYILSYFITLNVMIFPPGKRPHDPYKRLICELADCFYCMTSLSLLLRVLSRPLPHAVVKKHDKLYKFSMIYRIVRHIL